MDKPVDKLKIIQDRGSVKRLTLDEDYIFKVENKQAKDREKLAYFNSNKGLR